MHLYTVCVIDFTGLKVKMWEIFFAVTTFLFYRIATMYVQSELKQRLVLAERFNGQRCWQNSILDVTRRIKSKTIVFYLHITLWIICFILSSLQCHLFHLWLNKSFPWSIVFNKMLHCPRQDLGITNCCLLEHSIKTTWNK